MGLGVGLVSLPVLRHLDDTYSIELTARQPNGVRDPSQPLLLDHLPQRTRAVPRRDWDSQEVRLGLTNSARVRHRPNNTPVSRPHPSTSIHPWEREAQGRHASEVPSTSDRFAPEGVSRRGFDQLDCWTFDMSSVMRVDSILLVARGPRFPKMLDG